MKSVDDFTLPGTLHVVPGGFVYERDGRVYQLSGDPPPCTYSYVIDTNVNGTRYIRHADISVAAARKDFARDVAPGDEALQGEIRYDLNACRVKIQLHRIDLELGPPPEDYYVPEEVDEALMRYLREAPITADPPPAEGESPEGADQPPPAFSAHDLLRGLT